MRSHRLWMGPWFAVVVMLGLCVRTLAISEQSITVLEQDLASARQERQREREGWVLYSLGGIAQEQSQLRQAISHYEQALAIAQEGKIPSLAVGASAQLGDVYVQLGQYVWAHAVLEQALTLARAEQDLQREVLVGVDLGYVYYRLAQPDKALSLLEQTLALAREQQHRPGEGLALNRLGFIFQERGQPERALTFLEPALVLAQEGQDRRLQAEVLMNLGNVFRDLGQPERGLTLHELALVLAREGQYRREEGWALRYLGRIAQELGQPEQALPLYEQALTVAREGPWRYLEAAVLDNLGTSYQQLGNPEQALALYEQALTVSRDGQNRPMESWVLGHLGSVYKELGQLERALGLLQQTVVLNRERQDRRGEGWALRHLGRVYQELGQPEQALALYEQALVLARKGKLRGLEVRLLRTLGSVYQELGQPERALALLEQALAIMRERQIRWGEGWVLRHLGRVYQELRQPEQALALYERALVLAREDKDRRLEATVLNALGGMSQELSQPERALVLHEQALTVAQEIKHRRLEAIALAGCMRGWEARAQPLLAIFYGKLAVNVIQTLRGDLQRLDPELQQSFLQPLAWVYRSLAELLINTGRLAEAQQVIALLKEREFFDFVQRNATVGALQGQAALTPSEAVWAARYRAIADRLAALATEYGTLRHKPVRTAADTQRLELLEADLRVARHAFEQFLSSLQAEARQVPQVQERLARLAEESQGIMDGLRDLGAGTVALYTLVTDTSYRVILTTSEVQLARETPIAAADLARIVHAFRQALDPALPSGLRRDPRPLARELYQLLVAPVAQDLAQAQAQTLMWSLDGVLRYLPLAALHDGEQYLLERYRLAIFTPASATRLKDQPSPQWRGVGFGVSKAHTGFSALPTVPDELRGIIRDLTQQAPHGVLPGHIHLDEAFTDTTLRTALHERYPVVHIASHFQLHPGDDTASFLLLGDGSHLPLAQLKTWPQPFQGVELLTLSACNTAVGSTGAVGTEVEGLAVLAQRQGAKAVVATLWAVADTSTQTLMQTFYQMREGQPGLPKVEALRQAQLALLRGTGPPSQAATPMGSTRGIILEEGTRSGPGEALPLFVSEAQAPYAHPAYWAPFVLIGNWR